MNNININEGLNDNEVEKRIKRGLVNYDTTVKTKSVKRIIYENFFTLFNILNLILGIIIFVVGSYKNLLFLVVMLVNTIISTYQEIHSKKIIDKLSIVSSPKFTVLRNGIETQLLTNEIVKDDILILKAGNQIVTDSVIVDGEVLVNESIITGESDSISKKIGDKILSGSYIVSGKCKAQVEHIGEENYTYKISKDAKYIKKAKSEIMLTLNKIIKTLSIIIIPIGILLFFSQTNILGADIKNVIVQVVAALIGMIPEGLVLLTSTALAVSVVRLAKSKVLVQQLYSVETLARVDTLCLDKTGTLTEDKMKVKEIIPLSDIKQEKLEEIVNVFSKTSEDENSTIMAIREYFNNKDTINFTVKYKVAFSSETKWSAINFNDFGTYILGAPEFVTQNKKILKETSKYSNEYRVLVLGNTSKDIINRNLPNDIEILGIILITDVIRKEAKEVVKYFYEQGVDLKIISGDNPKTVSKVAKRVGIKEYDKYIDMTNIKEDEIEGISLKYSVFGRVTPVKKKLLVKAMKKQGRTVAMTGDGVNDVLALKEADTSIALANGSDATKSVSDLVLLNSNFSSMPKVVLEGRKTINNIERSAALFLVKTIYSCVLAVLFLFISTPYPFIPIQLTLISVVTIGIPSFLLALEQNKERVKGNFLKNIIEKALPASLSMILSVIVCVIMYKLEMINKEVYSTLCVMSTAMVGICLLFKLSKTRKTENRKYFVSPYRLVIAIIMLELLLIEMTYFNSLFNIIHISNISILAVKMGIVTILFFALFNIISYLIFEVNKGKK